MKPIDIYQFMVLVAAMAATLVLLVVCVREWHEFHAVTAHRTAIASVALLLVESGSFASFGVKMHWWAIETAEWMTSMGRTAILTLVIWLVWEKALDIKAMRRKRKVRA